MGNGCSHVSSLFDSVEDAREASWGVPSIGLTRHYACHLATTRTDPHPDRQVSICGVLCNAAVSLSKYIHMRLLLDFNMRLCVTSVSPGVPLQSRMKIYRNNIIVYIPVNKNYIDRAVEVSIVNEYSDVALRTVSIVNDSYRGVAQTSNASASCIYFVLPLENPWLTLLNTSHTTRLFDFSTIKPMFGCFNQSVSGCSVNPNYNHNPTLILICTDHDSFPNPQHHSTTTPTPTPNPQPQPSTSTSTSSPTPTPTPSPTPP